MSSYHNRQKRRNVSPTQQLQRLMVKYHQMQAAYHAIVERDGVLQDGHWKKYAALGEQINHVRALIRFGYDPLRPRNSRSYIR